MEKKIELLEKALKDNSNEAERSRVICGALNDLDSVKGSVKEDQRLKLQKELTTLQQLQNIGICNLKDENSAARLIFKIPRFYHISPILCTLHWLPVEFRIHFKIIIITFKAIHGQAPVYLQELINKREEKSYNLRSCAMGIMLQTPRTLTKKTLGDCAFLAVAPKLWNGLPSQIRNEPNFHTFKGLLKTHFCRLAFY